MIFIYICSHYSPLGRFIRIQHNNQYLVSLLERCTGIVKVIGSNPVRACFFFSGLMSTTSSVVFIAERVAYIRFEMRCECI